MSLIDEVRADQGRPTSQCQFCLWLEGRPKAEVVEWSQVMIDRSFTHSSLFRAAKKRGYQGGPSSVEGHRKKLHGLEAVEQKP